MAEEKQEKKIIVDEDWKTEAQKEKEEIKKEEQESPHEQERRMPPGDFAGLVSMLTTQAFFAMGVIGMKEDGKEQEVHRDMELAKYYIDLLGMLEEKTKGNLSAEEQKMLSGSLYQVRMIYVKVQEEK